MEVSFILSNDELYTLISLIPVRTEAGARFVEEALSGAQLCNLNGLLEKKLARRADGELELELAPVVRMLSDAIARADSAKNHFGSWEIRSQWVSLRCAACPHQENHLIITPLEGCK